MTVLKGGIQLYRALLYKNTLAFLAAGQKLFPSIATKNYLQVE